MSTSQFSGLFAPMYVCPEHGEIWHTDAIEEIDTEGDEVYERRLCTQCHRDVMPLLHDGHPVLHPLTDEEAYWDTYTGDDDEGEDMPDCAVCGGEFWDGGTSCICTEGDDDLEEDDL
jgi:hypothetical protein